MAVPAGLVRNPDHSLGVHRSDVRLRGRTDPGSPRLGAAPRSDELTPALAMSRVNARPGVVFAIGSAVLFAITTPLAKPLLRETSSPQLLAGLFYLGSGAGLGADR